ncbi:hypothetical protein GF068_37695 [Polyangium spumosum]|uniref:Uncharacterized protein n=2 Tax=Polyangium spumosum TaxID=889282 RepID=A0A6N7PZT9_9BACT|nr:hypothetical protein [Polyangium spumosum]
MPCQSPADCPMDTACRDWSCVQGMCAADDEAEGTGLPDPMAGDCKDLECDGMGNAVEVVDDADPPGGDGNPCTTAACVAGIPMQVNDPQGDTCPDGVCNGTGMCVECVDAGDCTGDNPTCLPDNTCISCSDGEMNGDETAVDCGGKCGKCPAEACAANAECKSGFCADGVCCDAACDGDCKSCKLTGSEGTCTNVPQGMTDDTPACMGTMACDGAGVCKLANGETCTNGGQCASGNCMGGANKTCAP